MKQTINRRIIRTAVMALAVSMAAFTLVGCTKETEATPATSQNQTTQTEKKGESKGESKEDPKKQSDTTVTSNATGALVPGQYAEDIATVPSSKGEEANRVCAGTGK